MTISFNNRETEALANVLLTLVKVTAKTIRSMSYKDQVSSEEYRKEVLPAVEESEEMYKYVVPGIIKYLRMFEEDVGFEASKDSFFQSIKNLEEEPGLESYLYFINNYEKYIEKLLLIDAKMSIDRDAERTEDLSKKAA